jgi:PIN domain nuclease of toxin-antitoxin system
MPLPQLVEDQREANDLHLLSVEAQHVYELSSLPLLHKDPFDRVLVAQAKAENMSIVSKDSIIRDYPVQVEW